MKNKIMIGIDQSYTDTGVTALLNKDEVLFCKSIKFEECEDNTEKRNMIYLFLERKLNNLVKISNKNDIGVIVERISIRSGKGGLSQSYVKSTAAMIGTIIDACAVYNIPVYSVDTRSWKAQIVGISTPRENKWGIPPEKYPTIEYLRDRKLLKYIVEEYEGRGTKGVISVKERRTGKVKKMRVNDNKADSFCIALYGFLPEEKQKLQLERF